MPRTRRPKLATEAEARQDEFKKAEALVNGKAEFKEAFDYHNQKKKRIAEDAAEDDEARVKRLKAEDEAEKKEAEEAHKKVAAKVAEAAKAVAFINGKAFYVSRKAEGHEKKEFKEVLPPGFRSLGRDPPALLPAEDQLRMGKAERWGGGGNQCVSIMTVC
ncbi:hypothetical protein ColKHC_07608 [Colletotrichum higginsianum]|nr:hypothetical protein ColKHC_07608 [Colletotrichum higginsianum]